MISRRHFLAGVAWSAPIVLAACSGSGKPATTPPPGAATTASSFGPQPPVEAPPMSASSAPITDAPVAPSSVTATKQDPATATDAVATTITPAGGPAAFIDHGDATSDMLALTFHLSGAPATVTALLDLLRQRGVTVTAFAVGTWITANPGITKRLVADGHELGNHTEHHLDMASLTPQQIRDEIVECGQAMMPFIGSIGRWFRPSSTVVPTQRILDAAGNAGYPVSVGYDIDSVDNKDPGPAAIVANVNPKLHGGAIVSLHFGHPGTIIALPHILDEIALRNLRPVTVGTLLG
jgi:peptidoglycan/xylan/chitin deacetylase (PgdA/CDA1 family)